MSSGENISHKLYENTYCGNTVVEKCAPAQTNGEGKWQSRLWLCPDGDWDMWARWRYWDPVDLWIQSYSSEPLLYALGVGSTHAMIKAHWIDDHELWQIVFVWCIIAVPCHHIEWWVIQFGTKQRALEFGNYFVVWNGEEKRNCKLSFILKYWFEFTCITIFKPSAWRLEVPWISEPCMDLVEQYYSWLRITARGR